jgi:hypothetical protein
MNHDVSFLLVLQAPETRTHSFNVFNKLDHCQAVKRHPWSGVAAVESAVKDVPQME